MVSFLSCFWRSSCAVEGHFCECDATAQIIPLIATFSSGTANYVFFGSMRISNSRPEK
jgi:hypothetical protein